MPPFKDWDMPYWPPDQSVPVFPDEILIKIAWATISRSRDDFYAWLDIRLVSRLFRDTIEVAFLRRYIQRMEIPFTDELSFQYGPKYQLPKVWTYLRRESKESAIALFTDRTEPRALEERKKREGRMLHRNIHFVTHYKPEFRKPVTTPMTAAHVFPVGMDFVALYHPNGALPEVDKNGCIWIRFDWKKTLTLFMVDERSRTPPSFSLSI